MDLINLFASFNAHHSLTTSIDDLCNCFIIFLFSLSIYLQINDEDGNGSRGYLAGRRYFISFNAGKKTLLDSSKSNAFFLLQIFDFTFSCFSFHSNTKRLHFTSIASETWVMTTQLHPNFRRHLYSFHYSILIQLKLNFYLFTRSLCLTKVFATPSGTTFWF